MIDCSNEMTGYYDDEVALPSTARTQMRDHRDANRKRLRNGLTKAEKPLPRNFHSQGSYAMKTMVQHDDNKYDIDDGVYFDKDQLVGDRGGEMTALAVRQMVRDAVDDGSFTRAPEVRKHCVRVYYQAGSRTKTKAAEIEHAIRHHLDIDLTDDPDLQASFAEALRRILEEFRDNWNQIFEELEKLRQRIVSAGQEPTYGLSRKKQMPFFRMLKKEVYADSELDDDSISSLVSLTQQIFTEVERELRLAGFWESIPARNKLKADIQRTLLQTEYSGLPGLVSNRQHIISRVLEIAEKNNDTILYANE
jgi:hypothetical protein